MRNRALLPGILLFLALWFGYVAVGQLLADRYGFLSREGVVISARAILATQSDPLTLASMGVPQPLLPFLAALPFALLRIPNPAIWASAFAGALLCTWIFGWFRRDAARQPILLPLLIIIPFVPGVFHDASLGTAGIATLALLLFSTHLAARFALDQQTARNLRHDGRLSAWTNPSQEQAHAIRFLWAAALMLGLACCARPDLILALPLFLLATPLLLPRNERRQVRKIVTIALLLYLPMIALQLMSGALSWSFNHDFARGVSHPATSLETLAPGIFLRPDVQRAAASPGAGAWHLIVGIALTCPLLFYVVARLRNGAVALLCLIPFVVEGLAIASERSLLSRDLFSLATLFTIVLILLGAKLGRFGRPELAALVVLTVASLASGWHFLSGSPQPEETVWTALAHGDTSRLETFPDERRIAKQIAARHGRHILLDETKGLVFITLLNRADPFILAHEPGFHFALENPQIAAAAALMQTAPAPGSDRDAIALAWSALGEAKTIPFAETASSGGWVLFNRRSGTVSLR